MSRFRRVKKEIRALLAAPDWQERLDELDNWTPGEIVPPLLSLRLDKDETVRWRSVTAFGITAARMADASMEKARVLMRTCMWYMNEESGNLGWTIPNFMGDAMARHTRLADEYNTILASYIFCEEECDGNYLDHPELRRDVFWGLARLAEKRPELVSPWERFLVAALDDSDPYNRGYAAWVLGLIKGESGLDALSKMVGDSTEIRTFIDGELVDVTVGDLAAKAVEAFQ